MLRILAMTGLMLNLYRASGQPAAEFEAVSIKPNKSGEVRSNFHASPGRLDATNVTARTLIKWAYRVRDFELSGEPAWVDSERFDVAAKADTGSSQSDLGTMFQSVLADRFKLAVHRTTQELPIYSLVVAKNGAKIHPVDEGDCPTTPAQSPCRYLRASPAYHLSGEKTSISRVVSALTELMGRTVLDKTSLTGSYSFTLDWTKYVQPPLAPPGAAASFNPFDPVIAGPAIATALEEQLGLKLESGKGPVELVVVDHIERPSEN